MNDSFVATEAGFGVRVQRLMQMTTDHDRISPVAKSGAIHMLEALLDLDRTFAGLLHLRIKGFQNFSEVIDPLLGDLPKRLLENDDMKIFVWARDLNRTLRRFLQMFPEDVERFQGEPFGEAPSRTLAIMIDDLIAEDQRLSMIEDESWYRSRTAALVEEAEQTASRLQEAAGIGGSATLSKHFAAYAGRERWSANFFRTLTIVSIASGVAAAALLPHPQPGDWVNFSYRVAQLVGIAALATYLGRQAGQHRRVFNWARSMQVQLQSFPAFVEPIHDPATVSGIYDAFARRVLGPPPEKAAASTGEDSFPSPQLLELLSAVAKKG